MSYKECEHCFGTGLDHGGCEHDLRIEKLETALKRIRDWAMSVIDDLTNLRPPCSRTQQEIDDLIEGIHELEGPQE
jgi:hypothetical protein